MKVKYIGPPCEYEDLISHNKIELKENEYYDIDARLDGPQMIVNGVPVITDDSTIWIDFPNDIHMAYSKQGLKNQWEGLI